MKARLLGLAVLLALAAIGYLRLATDTPTEAPARPFAATPGGSAPSPAPAVDRADARTAPADGVRRVVDDVAVKNYGKVIHRGSVDLSATIERIRAGIRHPHRNDGSVFGNRERLLPRQPRGYYREYVHPTDGLEGPGPQRIVIGREGDWWYTPDHYASFVSLGTEERR